ncbi:hypothetical protein HK102_004777 [Quaeritorhiza haematococci]|nr:hypothetical protein HK102_004777 [Quaeritorhiza haematococci]
MNSPQSATNATPPGNDNARPKRAKASYSSSKPADTLTTMAAPVDKLPAVMELVLKKVKKLKDKKYATPWLKFEVDFPLTSGQRRDHGDHLISELFLKLPSKKEYPDYYQVITNPIAINIIQGKIDRREYTSINDFRNDFSLMIKNAMTYNKKGSQVYKDAVSLEANFETILKEKLKSELGMETTDLPTKAGSEDHKYTLSPNVTKVDAIELKGQSYRQVHKASQKFMENEVFKTNHFEPYYIEEIVGRCYVLFVRDYVRGKPPGFNMADVFVCESRYNEQHKQYAKIKNWASCVPDSLRGKEVELELYDTPIVPNKVSSSFVKDEPVSSTAGAARKRKMSDDGSDSETSSAGAKSKGRSPKATDRRRGMSPALSRMNSAQATPQLGASKPSEATEFSFPEKQTRSGRVTRASSTLPSPALTSAAQTPSYNKSASAPGPQMQSQTQGTRPQPTPQGGAPMGAAATPYGMMAGMSFPPGSAGMATAPIGMAPGAPGYTAPVPRAEYIPDDIVDKFDITDDKKIKWFAAPPVHVLEEPLVHSLEYLAWKREQHLNVLVDFNPAYHESLDKSSSSPELPSQVVMTEANVQPPTDYAKQWKDVGNVLNVLSDLWFQDSKVLKQVAP